MEFKIGQKVNTPAVGVIKYYMGGKTVWVTFNENMAEIEFDIKHLKPYKTAHERLLEMGFRQSQNTLVKNTLYTIYEIDGGSITIIEGKENYYKTKMKVNLELSRILTQYLEEIEA